MSQSRHVDETPDRPTAAERAAEPAPYVAPELTELGTVAQLTQGTNFGDGGDVHAYQS